MLPKSIVDDLELKAELRKGQSKITRAVSHLKLD
jgi:hypothetical protein